MGFLKGFAEADPSAVGGRHVLDYDVAVEGGDSGVDAAQVLVLQIEVGGGFAADCEAGFCWGEG